MREGRDKAQGESGKGQEEEENDKEREEDRRCKGSKGECEDWRVLREGEDLGEILFWRFCETYLECFVSRFLGNSMAHFTWAYLLLAWLLVAK